ncbi:MAG TPA: diaminopimelate epimerase [Actinobacteria bacterium]|nr:diaminopimelate epimerase [Actinomycetota bacterium]
MDFVKMEALGNDFIVVEGPLDDPTSEEVRAWCRRRFGIGADGLLEATRREGAVGMRYWNADGHEAEICGNGLRCVARLAAARGWVEGSSFVVETAVGPRRVEVRDDMVRAELGRPYGFRTDVLAVAGTEVRPVGLGNPHAVLFVDDVGAAPVGDLGPRIGTDAIFPGGTNVEFAEVVDDGRLRLRVWERGVGETLACGSGAAAAVVVAQRAGRVAERVVVELPGGELVVEVDGDVVWIEGPANFVFTGRVPAELPSS